MSSKKELRQYVWKYLSTSLYNLKVKILFSRDRELVNLEGTIIDETSKMLILETSSKIVSIPKKDNIFLIELPNGNKFRVDGHVLMGRPEQRLKKLPRYW